MRHVRYGKYLAKHKWFVFLAACRLGIPFLGIMHDMSKFRPSEWVPYANFFYGPKAKPWRDETGYYKPVDTGNAAFEAAWFLHQKRNRHHWQYWCLPIEDGEKVLPMPDKYCREMLADWIGAGRAQGRPDTLGWYTANQHKMRLHPDTRAWIEDRLGYQRDAVRGAG